MSLDQRESFDAHTTVEGGNWQFTYKGLSIPNRLHLEALQKAAKDDKKNTVKIYGTEMHSFRTLTGKEWDVINGWRPNRG